MLKVENAEVLGWEHAIRGMRNPMNSWDKSDSEYPSNVDFGCLHQCGSCKVFGKDYIFNGQKERGCIECFVGDNDLELMTKLRNDGTDHRKFLRMITVYADITAPLYWWKEYDTYKVGTVTNSCSTMHKIHDKEFTLDDFSCEYLIPQSMEILEKTIEQLNDLRKEYNDWNDQENFRIVNDSQIVDRSVIWHNMIQLLPASYNQRRTVMLNYEVLANIYKSRKNHKLDEWRTLCRWIERLPYSELITGKGEE